MNKIALSLMTLIAACLFLIGCGGNGGGSSSGGGGGGGSGGGGAGGPSIPSEVEWQISPFDDGLRIQWQDLPDFERAGVFIHLNLTYGNPPQLITRRIAIADFTNNSYTVSGLANGTAYHLVEVRVELADSISRVVDIAWLWEENEEDNKNTGIVVGPNYDMDWRANSEDGDDDNDGIADRYMNGAVRDMCSRGELKWLSDNATDYDGDGCRDAGEDTDCDNDGVEDGDEVADQCVMDTDCDNDGVEDGDEVADQCVMDTDCDNDGVEDGDEVADQCVIDTDCDNDGVEDGDEVADQCVIDTDCDNDGVEDGDEVADQCVMDADCDNDGVEDGDEVADQCVMDTDCDDDGVEDGDEVADQCVIDTDCDNDELLDNNTRERLVNRDGISCSVLVDCDGDNVEDGDEVADQCVIDTDCDNDGVEDGDEAVGCTLERNCDNDDLGDSADSCPAGLTGWRDDGSNDVDGDGCRNDEDVDIDGNGLIEIETAAKLDAVRYVLNGTGFKANEEAVLNQSGCGDGMDMTGCNGYELVGDISLSDYIRENYPTTGWQPIASDIDTGNTLCDGDEFTAIFDGNGFVLSGLFINRSEEDCIGLFGQASGSIRDLGVVADEIEGRRFVGGLVGWGASASIAHAYAVTGEVRGNAWYVGGLVGWGASASITHSYAVTGGVNGGGWHVGGLVGWGASASIVQSYAVSDEVRGDTSVGGLVGRSDSAAIIQSYAVTGGVRGNRHLGGLLGYGPSASIAHSYAVAGEVDGSRDVGGLVGFGGNADLSYWDTETSGRTNSAAGSGQTTSALRSPTGYTGIYDIWDDGATPVWCDENLSGVIETGERRDNNKVWDFGTATEYPALRCTPDSLTDQRAWWSLTDGDPQLDQTRLNTRLNQ